jgi:nucleotidyltransferase substrate binding protein (TIGR01987 family)
MSRTDDLRRAVAKLAEVIGFPDDPIRRDSAILRFQLAYELAWKTLQKRATAEGIEANSPRQAFEAGFRLGLLDGEEVWSDMIRERNTAVHVYREEFAQALYNRLPRYLTALEQLIKMLGA